MPNLTTNFDFNKPLVNNATDADLWGGYLNDNWDSLDTYLSLTTASKTSDFNVAVTEFNYTYLIDASGGAVTATLPAVANVWNGFTVRFKGIDVSNTVTIDGNGSETIDGATTVTINATDNVIEVVSDGTGWQITTSTTSFADDTEVKAGTEGAKAIAPKFWGDNLDTSSDGYQYLPGGLLMQWGTKALVAPGTAAVTFPETFANGVLSIQATGTQSAAAGSNNNAVVAIDSDDTTTSGFTLIGDEVQGTVNITVYWFAIGY